MIAVAPALTDFDLFQERIRHEFILGSDIDPSLFYEAVRFHEDIEHHSGGDVSTPIHDALGWKYTRFGHRTRESLYAACLLNEDGSCWQAKLSKPVWDVKKGRIRKYETPVGNGSRAYLPSINVGTWIQISKRYEIAEISPWLRVLILDAQSNNLNTLFEKWSGFGNSPRTGRHGENWMAQMGFCGSSSPRNIRLKALSKLKQLLEENTQSLTSLQKGNPTQDVRAAVSDFIGSLPHQVFIPDFWQWLEQHPEIPIVFSEGGKKSLCLLSRGYIAISLYGVTGGYRSKDALGNPITPYLIEDVKFFAKPGREIILAFDQDEKPETRSKVNRALSRFGGLLVQQGCSVRVAQWDGSQGKGADDLIVNCGAEAFDIAYDTALPLEHWQLWNRLDNCLTYKPSLKLQTQDLSTLAIDDLPDQGIFAIASAKGTGKTKFIGGFVSDSERVLLGGHRICLLRNLCHRLGVGYIGDLDKANGHFINGSAYTLRVGLCLDSLLAIDPKKFRGCDLVLDETAQVLRHLLTSATCKKDGKLPALLSRLHELVKVARRVILADADLNNASLDYIRQLRGDNAPVYLIRNTYQPQGYPVRFIQAPDASVITAELLRDISQLQPGEVILVQTDSKTGSKTLARLVQQVEGLGRRLLLLNSETSGGETEREFIADPDAVLARGEYDVVVASPSMATGVSIESSPITKVYGIFYGASSTDADMAQALSRVRNPQAARVVWCAKRGLNFSQVSRSTNPLELKADLKTRTDVSVSLIRSNLREDVTDAIAAYDWQSDPHLNLWARIEAERNHSMHNLRTALLVRLKYEGNQITVENLESDFAIKQRLKQAKDEVRQVEAVAVAGAKALSSFEVKELESREGISPEDRLAIARYYLGDFYCTEVSPELVQWDNDGHRRRDLLNLEAQLLGIGLERDVRSVEKQASWGKGLVPWDLGNAELKRQTRSRLDLEDFFNPNKEWTKHDIKPYAERARQYAQAIKTGLNFTITEGMSDVQIIHQLLSQMGIKIKFRWQRINGEKTRIYRLDADHWQAMTQVLERRQGRRESVEPPDVGVGSPPFNSAYTGGGDPRESPSKETRRTCSCAPLQDNDVISLPGGC